MKSKDTRQKCLVSFFVFWGMLYPVWRRKIWTDKKPFRIRFCACPGQGIGRYGPRGRAASPSPGKGSEGMQQSQSKRDRIAEYKQLIARITPKSKLAQGCLRAFWVGGGICVLGQGLMDYSRAAWRLTQPQASAFASIVLVFLTALLTGLGVFDRIAKYAGAGTVVPITGFANAMVSPAMEFRPEGFVLGTGARLFTIAGPVLVYGVSASVIVGILYYFIG